ncbi:MAG: helix-hairpin-helix domain-containing protein [Gammaproteobacteria bacterium]|nr:helix-hairpin-helix domain-containing protein [Gammaproteobacteria bacterium]
MSIFHYVKLSCAVLLIGVIGSQAVAASHGSHHSTVKRPPVAATQRIDINHANVATLAAVKGLSHKRAQAIVDWRYQHGSF